jgi:hypothetical protein
VQRIQKSGNKSKRENAETVNRSKKGKVQLRTGHESTEV